MLIIVIFEQMIQPVDFEFILAINELTFLFGWVFIVRKQRVLKCFLMKALYACEEVKQGLCG
ncbi:hypothetical protein GCM10009409_27110 [Shewanella saliphila]|uniref:Uncharacterized protein n=1 Tax=Shewanella saliphila TaxID=2282698 RepID=A0ABQ2Q8T5_9GAMM|nr:hypothetical protein GCM10009409_27110 [Shewanella saliphila]